MKGKITLAGLLSLLSITFAPLLQSEVSTIEMRECYNQREIFLKKIEYLKNNSFYKINEKDVIDEIRKEYKELSEPGVFPDSENRV